MYICNLEFCFKVDRKEENNNLFYYILIYGRKYVIVS